MVTNFYYNIFRRSNDEFIGTVAVRLDLESETPPSERAVSIAETKIDAAATVGNPRKPGFYAVMSTKEMHLQYGLN